MSSPLKFYTDEHVPTAVVKALHLRGIDVLTTKEAGMLSASDKDHLELALNLNRVIITQDKDFLVLHSQGIEHCGITYAHQQTSIGDMVRGFMLVHQILTIDDMKNHLEFL